MIYNTDKFERTKADRIDKGIHSIMYDEHFGINKHEDSELTSKSTEVHLKALTKWVASKFKITS